ncbi:MAG: DMT family transporter [Burkholderiaceae bacterium]
MSPELRVRWAQTLLFIAPALWSVNYLVARLAPGVIEPHLLALLRWSFALALMLPFALGELRRHWPRWRHEIPDLVLLGALGMWVCGAFVYIGGRTTTAANIGLIYAMAPVMIAAISARLFGDRLGTGQKLGVAMAAFGMVLIIIKGSFANLVAVRFTVGDLWVLTAVLCWTAYSVLLRRQPTCLGPFARLTAITMGGVLVLVPFTLAEIADVGLPTDWPRALMLAVAAALLPGFGAYQAYSFMQRELGPARTGLVLYLGPLYAAFVGWWILGEQPTWYHGLGACLILPGIYLANRQTRARSTARIGAGLRGDAAAPAPTGAGLRGGAATPAPTGAGLRGGAATPAPTGADVSAAGPREFSPPRDDGPPAVGEVPPLPAWAQNR